jgi:hypothetical protein
MARDTIDTDARDQAREALIAATTNYDKAIKAVDDARIAQHARIVEARLDGIRQVDITGLTQTDARPRGFTREHVRRIELSYRKRLAWARNQGMDIEKLTTEDVLRIVLPGEEDERDRVTLADDDLGVSDTDDDEDDDEDEVAEDREPAGVVA